MPRVKVTVRYVASLKGFVAHDMATGERITDYSQLCYGDTDAARSGDGEDETESGKTFANPSIDQQTKRRRDSTLKTDAVLVAWVTVPH